MEPIDRSSMSRIGSMSASTLLLARAWTSWSAGFTAGKRSRLGPSMSSSLFYPDGIKALAHWADLDVLETRTHWDDEGWTDGDQWHDSVLVARKAIGRQGVLTPAKQSLLRWIT